MAPQDKSLRQSRVPSGRAERFAKLSLLAGKMAFGAAAEGARRLTGAESTGHVLLSAANSRRLADSLSSMRGAAMKLGQLLSLEGDDLLPAEAMEALASLRDAGDAMPEAQLRAVLAYAWGRDWETRFESFELEPIAAASIGQVHAARTRDGRDLALKIQYPGVSRSIDSDVDNLASAFKLARILPSEIDLDPLIAEAKRQLRDEADYQTEAGYLKRYRSLLADQPEFVVPAVHEDLTTKTILAMDRLDAMPLEELCSPSYEDRDRDRAATLLVRLVLREFFEFRFIQSDPNFANYMLLRDGRLGLIDLGAGYAPTAALSRGYAAMMQSAAEGDRKALEEAVIEIGFLKADEDPGKMKAMLDLILLATEPFRCKGAYDFGASELPARAREASMKLVLEAGFVRPPPPETLFLQRKLGGTFLLCTRLRARVDARALLDDALAREVF